MVQRHDDHLSGLERHTQILSDKVEELRASLFTFQRWYLDYLDLKEEVDAVSRSAAKTTTSPQPSTAQQRAVDIAASASTSPSTSASTSASTSTSPSSTAPKTSSNSDADGIDPPGTRAGLARIRRDFQGAIITRADVADIFGRDIDQLRSLDHISSALGRRIDYVEQNVATLERLVAQAEKKLAAARVVASPDFGIAADDVNGDDNDDGSRGGDLPITDIVETLNEDGNVVDFRLQTGGEAGKTIMEVLGRAGVKGFSEEDVPETNKKMDSLVQERKPLANGPGAKNVPDPQLGAKTPEPAAASAEHPKLNKTVSFSEDTKPKHKPKKTVSFADDTRPGHELKKKVSFSQDTKPSRNDTRQGEQPSGGMKINGQLVRLMEEARRQEAMDMSKAVMPEDESAEDRELRRQMLEYSMSEIGPVVAELTIEDGDATEGSDVDDLGWDDEDEDIGEDDSYGDAHEEEEDETGRSKISVINSTYVKRMQELEKRLAFQTAFSATSSKQPFQTSSRVLPSEKGGLVRIEVAEHQDTFAEKPAPPPDASAPVTTSLIEGGGKTKAVRFATQELHVAEEDASSAVKQQPGSRSISADEAVPSAPPVNPLGDVLERASGGSKASPQQHSPQQGINGDLEEAQPPKRVSRFKKAHMKENGNGHPSQQRQPAPPPQTPEPPSSAAAAAATGSAIPKSPLEMAAVLATRSPITAVPPAASAAPPDPTGPEGRTLADTVVERAMATAPRDPDDMDDMLLYRAAAVEYNILRNRMIQRQGGFARPAGEEGEETEMVMMARAGGEAEAAAAEEEEEQGEDQPRPMSRFRAARLARGL